MQPISLNERLRFSCHPGVSCFTECCRELDLVLTPYDVLRLKRHLGISAEAFLDRYVIVAWEEGQTFPLCYLSMVDDGRASCVFVGTSGCTVYADRPGSCRAYPLGRGASLVEAGLVKESLLLLRESHCLGFAENEEQSAAAYLEQQGLAEYNRYNDALLPLLQHPLVRSGQFQPNRLQLDQYMLALYNLDQFRLELSNGNISLHQALGALDLQGLAGDDEALLLLAIRWLMQEFFGA